MMSERDKGGGCASVKGLQPLRMRWCLPCRNVHPFVRKIPVSHKFTHAGTIYAYKLCKHHYVIEICICMLLQLLGHKA